MSISKKRIAIAVLGIFIAGITLTPGIATIAEDAIVSSAQNEENAFIINIVDEFSYIPLELDMSVQFVQMDSDTNEIISKVDTWNTKDENSHKISQSLLDNTADYYIIIDELPQGYSYTYHRKSSVISGVLHASDLNEGDNTITLYIRNQPAEEQISYPISGTIPVEVTFHEFDTEIPIENMDVSFVLLNEDKSVKEILHTWNTSQTEPLITELPYTFTDETSRVLWGLQIQNFPEEYEDYSLQNGCIVETFYPGDLESILRNKTEKLSFDISLERKDTVYTYVSTDNSTTTTTTTTTTIFLTSGDANNDGKVDILDIITTNKALLGKEKLSDKQLKAIDFNNNGKPDADEALTLLKYIVGLISEL